MSDIIKQRAWTPDQLIEAGFQQYARRKQRVLAARLPFDSKPLPIHYTFETVYADPGDVIIFEAGSQAQDRLSGYNFWSVKPRIFANTYKGWDEPNWRPNPAEKHLMQYGCRPYYKFKGVWARRLTEPTAILSLESPKPNVVPAGVWLAIGDRGEPWHIEDETFRKHYQLSQSAYTQ